VWLTCFVALTISVIEIPVDVESSLSDLRTFLGGENALSQDGGSVTRKVPQGPEHSCNEGDE
jgi:hypothetical protein